MCCFLERGVCLADTGGWLVSFPPREEFVLQELGPVLVPLPEEHDVGTLLLAVGCRILAIDKA